jgi:hypothetical protein
MLNLLEDPTPIFYTFKKNLTLIYPTLNFNFSLTLIYVYLFINGQWV